MTKYASQGMIKAGLGGSIVNVSSQASLVGLAGHISVCDISALELGKYDIRVNAVTNGCDDTDDGIGDTLEALLGLCRLVGQLKRKPIVFFYRMHQQ